MMGSDSERKEPLFSAQQKAQPAGSWLPDHIQQDPESLTDICQTSQAECPRHQPRQAQLQGWPSDLGMSNGQHSDPVKTTFWLLKASHALREK